MDSTRLEDFLSWLVLDKSNSVYAPVALIANKEIATAFVALLEKEKPEMGPYTLVQTR